jgi:alkylhydroperoxidase family enzyme
MLHHPRIAPVSEDQLTPAQRTILETLAPHRRQFNVYCTLVRHPALAQRFFVFGHYILSESTLPPRDRELVILRVGWLCRSEYEWSRHTIIAQRVGLTEMEIQRITEGPTAPDWSPCDVTLLHAVDELHEHAVITRARVLDIQNLHYAIAIIPPSLKNENALFQKIVHDVLDNGPHEASFPVGESHVHVYAYQSTYAEDDIDWALEYWRSQRDAVSTQNPNKCAPCEYKGPVRGSQKPYE